MPDDLAPETSAPRPGTTDPRRSRMRALKVLFQADLRDRDPSAAIAEIAVDPAAVALLDDLDDETVVVDRPIDDYARSLVDGVAQHRHGLDEIIGQFSHRWEVARMPVVDRNILRMATWELLSEDVSQAVVIDEALELAKELSTDASHRFVNGILEAVRRDADTLQVRLAEPDADLGDELALDEPVADLPTEDEAADDGAADDGAADDGAADDQAAGEVPAGDVPVNQEPARDEVSTPSD